MTLKINMLENEYWWGGTIAQAEKMPFDCNTETVVNLVGKRSTVQAAPLFLSSKGRYIWSEKGFIASFKNGEIVCDGDGEIILNEESTCLKEAFVNAKRTYFPFETTVRTPREFYQLPQFNTWMELVKEQTEENILAYAEGLSKNGYKRGILIIDDGWQETQGLCNKTGLRFT